MKRKLRKAYIAVYFWLKHGLQWRDQYMKFGLRTAWGMAEEMLDFRDYCRERGIVIERESVEP